jgi:Lon protease-like protein
MCADGGQGSQFLTNYIPFIRDMKSIEHKATAHVCRNFACLLPTTSPSQLIKLLETSTNAEVLSETAKQQQKQQAGAGQTEITKEHVA